MTAEERAARRAAKAAERLLDAIPAERRLRAHELRVTARGTGGDVFVTHARLADLDAAVDDWRRLRDPAPEEPRKWRVYCSQFASCRWAGYRRAEHREAACSKPCPRCGREVSA